MATFAWQGTDDRGRRQRGECAAGGLEEAVVQIRARGIALLSMERLGAESAIALPATADAFVLFNRTLAEMTAIGLPLPRAIGEISSGMRGGRFKRALDQVEAALREGKPMDEAVATAPEVFPAYYRWMLKAGAESGNLPRVLSAVARNTEGLHLARRAFLEALIYPAAILLTAALLAAGALLLFVPFYRDLSVQMGFDSPGLSLFLRTPDLAWILAGAGIGLAVLAAAGLRYLRRTISGERLLGRIPLVGRIHRHLSMARLLGTLGILLRSDVPLVRALPVAFGATGSLQLDQAAEVLAAQASEGRGLGEVLAHAPGVSPETAAFMALAERSGDAPDAALQVADLLTEQAVVESEALFTLLVPLALLIAGLIVGSCLVSVVLPWVRFLETLSR